MKRVTGSFSNEFNLENEDGWDWIPRGPEKMGRAEASTVRIKCCKPPNAVLLASSRLRSEEFLRKILTSQHPHM